MPISLQKYTAIAGIVSGCILMAFGIPSLTISVVTINPCNMTLVMPLKDYALGTGISLILCGLILISASIVTFFVSWFKYVEIGLFVVIGGFLLTWVIVGSVSIWSANGPKCSSVNYSLYAISSSFVIFTIVISGLLLCLLSICGCLMDVLDTDVD